MFLDFDKLYSSTMSFSGDVFEPVAISNAKQRATLVEWLNSLLPNQSLPINALDEDLRAFLVDGTVLCEILNKLKPGSVAEYDHSPKTPESRLENVKKFLSAMDRLGLPRFQLSDLEKGSMKIVLECLLTLRTHFMPNVGGYSRSGSLSPNPAVYDSSTRWKQLGDRVVNSDLFQKEDRSRMTSPFQRALRSPVMAEPSAALLHHVGQKFHEVFQAKQGRYADLPATKISEMMQPNSLDNAPTQSLLSVVNGILDESTERKNGEIPHRVACLLRKVVQEIERRISTQAEHLRTQNNLFKTREEKYQSRIRVLETLAIGTSEEIKEEKSKISENKRVDEQEVAKLTRQNEDQNREISTLKKDLARSVKEKEDRNHEISALKQEVARLSKDNESQNNEISALKPELQTAKKTNQELRLRMEMGAQGAQQELENKLSEVSVLLTDSRKRVKELEASQQGWNKKEHLYEIFSEFQLGALRELKFTSQSIKQEVVKTQKTYSDDFNRLGRHITTLQNAAASYYSILTENQKLHNELQELKGNIRVYCRVRPFLPGQKERQSIVEYIGENGELVVVNPSKQGKESRRSFKFNKVYGPSATQAQVFSDTQPLIQSVLDGYSVCIFAYGQTGSGKTYTMTGPDRATEEEWGVNYRALNDLFNISQSRESTFAYEISVQMVEIYNEQVRDLLSSDGSQKKLGILSASQQNGLAVPDASMYPVKSTDDVLDLMDIGLKNRAKGATALNERSSRSHSILSIHVRGVDQKTGSSMRSSLHLVDLAGSERVDRSEVTGDRLKEAQHINKSLSALGDVIFALAQKSPHVPYRNSKLTQVLQGSLGGKAKTLMFVQLNPDANSFSETLSTLKFAERVSGVELGAAKTSKDGRDIRELMEQVASLKDTIAKKDEEIERLQPQKDLKNAYHGVNDDKYETDGSGESDMSSLGSKQSDTVDKHRVESRVPRPPDKYSNSLLKGSTGLRKSPSTSDLTTNPAKRWH